MTCYHPLEAYQVKPSLAESAAGQKSSIIFNRRRGEAAGGSLIELPCGQCIGCRIARSREWAIRCVHEASRYEDNCFITLTYNNAHLPSDGSLDVTHWQKFMKRVRKKFGKGVRFYHCGEYGDTYGRPHYHACLFNFDFPDKKLWKIVNEQKLYTSQILEDLWGMGFCSIGSVTFQSAAYVARYIMKKVTGKNADNHYESVDEYGVVTWRKPEYTTMSRRPGIGKAWFDEFHSDVYPHDFVVLNQAKMRPPRFYDNQLELINPLQFDMVKVERELNAMKNVDNCSKSRLLVREEVQKARLSKLPRVVE